MVLKLFLFLGCIFTTCHGEMQSIDFTNNELETIILRALQDNQTDVSQFSNATDEMCKPFSSKKPNFTKPGRRISETKCLEYAWEVKNMVDQNKADDDCRVYLISQIKRGIIPEILVFVPPTVIFGGRNALPAEFLHMGAIGWRSKDSKWVFKCGGSLISEKFVLTAAHCSWLPIQHHLDVQNNEPEVVRFGVENIEDDEFNIHGNPVDVNIKKIIKHPQYNPPKKYLDIALLELDTIVKFSHNIFPACLLPKKSKLRRKSKGKLTGWGVTEHGKPSTILQVATVDILRPKRCTPLLRNSWNRNWHGFAKHQLCAGRLAGKVDSCQGDSGGPLQIKMNSEYNSSLNMIVGLTSFGIRCGQKDKPGVYTRVSYFLDWIEDTVWGSLDESIETSFRENRSLFKRKNNNSTLRRSYVRG